jgi:hypothetical protein
MPYPPISALPTPPSRNSPSNFSALMDAFLAAFPQFRSEVNALAAYLDTLSLQAGATVTNSPTDTTAGRLLKVGDHGLGSVNPRATGVILNDWLNTSSATGFHHMGNDSETLNKPGSLSGAGWGSALTVRTSDVIGARIGWRGYRNSNEFFMQKWDSDGWGWLLKFFNNRNILGTVTQVGGVPDGAIIERGSNANGSYTRWADGTQICWNAAGITTNPAAFSDTPVSIDSNKLRIGRWF